MPVRKYRLVDIVKDGKKEKAYYSYDTDSYLDIDSNGKDDVIFYDEDNKIVLKGDKLKHFLENNPDYIYDSNEVDADFELDQELENTFGVNVLYESLINSKEIENEKERVKNKYFKIFESKNMCDLSNLVQGMKLDHSKKYQDQKITQSMFNKAVEYTYHDERHGHSTKMYDITYVGVDKLFEEFLLLAGYHLHMKNDDDLTFKEKEENSKLKKQNKKEYFDYIENLADQKNLKDEERDIFINKLQKEYNNKYESLIYNNQLINGYLSTTDMERRVTINEKGPIAKPAEEEALIEASKLSVIAGLLGYGNPQHAFKQFLDPVALKNNQYKFNDKAIDKFLKDIKITSKDKEAMVYNAYDHAAFTEMYKEAIVEDDIKDISFDGLLAFGKNIYKNPKNIKHSDKFYVDVALKKRKEDAYISKNKKVLSVAKLYNDMKLVRSKKPWYYVIAHPMKAFMEYQTKNEMLNYIKDNAIEDTEFKNKINDYIKCGVKDQDKYYKEADLKVNEPKENDIYFEHEIDEVSLSSSAISKYNNSEYLEEEINDLSISSEDYEEIVNEDSKTLIEVSELNNDIVVEKNNTKEQENVKEELIKESSKEELNIN